ncbi:TOX high mobility group box family member 4-B isoform X2 [Drosophila willistoni]|uniref:TOX high mobility group box family member 4-B isoform X2 n=1 Tax=Drosophila willistoni TaxID=7260 RepID=UPI000C26C6C3|nr:TOX high mobility group box family member 4-B isoform X2 [Drosophila willistoni]
MKKLLSRRMLSLDHSTLNDDDDMDYDTYNGGQQQQQQHHNHAMMTQQQQQQAAQLQQQQQILPHLPTDPVVQAATANIQTPSKPMAPFALFFRDTVTAIKQQNPTSSFEEITLIAQNMWDALDVSQKSIYNQRHELEKREYLRLMRDYQQHLSETTKPDNTSTTMVTAETTTPVSVSMPAESVIVSGGEQSQHHHQTQQDHHQQQQQQMAVTGPAQPPEQIPLLSEAASVTKCTREQCNKPAIINPDWEDEYCSNECVVIHCRNVFNEWALSLKTPNPTW